MNFRAKTSLTIAVLTALALGGAFAAVTAAFNGLQRSQLDASLRAVASDEALESPRNHFTFSDRPGPAANDVGPLTKYGVIYDEAGRVLSATPPFDVRPPSEPILHRPLGEPFDLRSGRDHMRGVVIAIPEHPDKRLFLATSRDDLDGDEAFLFKAMVAAFLVSVLWVGMVAYWMGGRLTRDHRDIASVVRAVAAGDLSARVQLRSSDPAIEQLTRDLNDMVEQLSELVSSHQRFIAHAAHELRSPLAALYGELQQSLRRPRDSEGYRAAIGSALGATRRLIALADDLLALARVRGEPAPAGEPVSVESIAASACASVAELARSREIAIVTELKSNCQIADRNGDTTRLLRNLLENAIHHSKPGDEVRLEAVREKDQLQLRVRDAGPGVHASEREKIFEPFFRGRGSTGTDGTGLGLGIARQIARAHGGDVVLDTSRDQAGAQFVILLPVVSDLTPA